MLSRAITATSLLRRMVGSSTAAITWVRPAAAHRHWTRKAAAAKLEMNDNKLWRLETGQVSSQPIVIRSICNVYGIDQRRADALVALSRLTEAKGWWHSYGEVLPDWFEAYIDLESAATELLAYDSLVVPGIMQT